MDQRSDPGFSRGFFRMHGIAESHTHVVFLSRQVHPAQCEVGQPPFSDRFGHGPDERVPSRTQRIPSAFGGVHRRRRRARVRGHSFCALAVFVFASCGAGLPFRPSIQDVGRAHRRGRHHGHVLAFPNQAMVREGRFEARSSPTMRDDEHVDGHHRRWDPTRPSQNHPQGWETWGVDGRR
eukprot:scaffold310_cov335-Pavlova_lutheri.AAC.17